MQENFKKEFIQTINPTKESIKHISSFAKLSKDLNCLSQPELSLMAYEFIYAEGRKQPMNCEIVQKELKKQIRSEMKVNGQPQRTLLKN